MNQIHDERGEVSKQITVCITLYRFQAACSLQLGY